MNRKSIARGQALLFSTLFAMTLASPLPTEAGGVDGIQQRQKVNDLTHEVTWFDNMPQALASARQKGKPLVWIHMLGKIDGAT